MSSDDLPSDDSMIRALDLLQGLENVPPPEDVFPFPVPGAEDQELSTSSWIEEFDRALQSPLSSVCLHEVPPPPAPEKGAMESLLDDLLAEEQAKESDPPRVEPRATPEEPDAEELPSFQDVPDPSSFHLEPSATPTLADATAEMSQTTSAEEVVEGKPYLLFSLAECSFAVDLAFVREICPLAPITPLPLMPAWLRGVAGIRGNVLSVLDLPALLGLGPRHSQLPPARAVAPVMAGAPRQRLLILHVAAEDLTAGMVVEGSQSIGRFPEEAVSAVTVVTEPKLTTCLLGQIEQAIPGEPSRHVLVLDVPRLLRSTF
jgi:chemotaxis signal transduction protein